METRLLLQASVGGFIGGIVLRSFFDPGPFYFGFFLILLGLTISMHRYIRRKFETQKNKAILLISVSLISFGLGVVRFDISDLNKGSDALDNFVDQKVSLEGVITEEPIDRENSQRIIIDVDRLVEEEVDVDARVVISAERYPQFSYGDRLLLSGVLQSPKSFETESGRLFDYPAYLAKDNIAYQMFFPELSFISDDNGNIVKEKLFSLKGAFLERVLRIVPQPHASLLGGLVVGAQESMSRNLLDDFRETGIIHIIVLSGYNVTIVAEAIIRTLNFLPSAVGTSLGVLGIVLFAAMTGASATTVRASIMALIVILSRVTGRRFDITRALLIAGALMILHNPKILRFDPSFQLSFLATLGLIYVAPLIERRLGFISDKWNIRGFATATIATQIFVLPMLLFMTGQFSFVSLPVNILVLGVVPLTMLFGFLAGGVAFVSTFIALPFAFVTYALLAYILKVVDLFASLPFASVAIRTVPAWSVAVFYMIYAVAYYFLWHKKTAGS